MLRVKFINNFKKFFEYFYKIIRKFCENFDEV